MTPIKRNLLYVFRGTLLRLRISWEGKNSVTISLGYHINREKWDKSRCVKNSSHGEDKIPAATINKKIEKTEEKIEKIFYSFEIEDRIPSQEEFKAALLDDDSQKKDFWTAYREFIIEGEGKKQWADNTVKSIKQVYNLIKAFDPDLSFETLNEEKLEDFIKFQTKNTLRYLNYKKKHKKDGSEPNMEHGFSNAVIIKNCRIFKWFLRWAAYKGYISSEIERNFKPSVKAIEKPVIFLDEEELKIIENMNLIPDSKEDMARDFFCFCCYSSLRYSDALKLKKTDVKKSHIEIISQKTDKPLIIDLNTHTKRILAKYKKSNSIYALPQMAVDKLNYYLKQLAKEAGIDSPITITQYYGNKKKSVTVPKYELISSHCGRRTFICIALSHGIPPNIIMKWTGHSEYSAMKPYLEIIDKLRSEAMKIFDEK